MKLYLTVLCRAFWAFFERGVRAERIRWHALVALPWRRRPLAWLWGIWAGFFGQGWGSDTGGGGKGGGEAPIMTLRRQVDGVSRALTNRTEIFEVVGRVNTGGELGTAPDALFFLEDSSGGIAIRWLGGNGKGPPLGATVRVRGVLSQTRGLLQLNVHPENSRHGLQVERLEGEPMTPALLDAADLAVSDRLEAMEGRRVKLRRVRFTSGGALREGVNQTMVFESGDAAAPIRIFDRAQTWIGVQKPRGVVSVEGILSQSDTSSPFDSGYFVWVTESEGLVLEKPGPKWSLRHQIETRVGEPSRASGSGSELVVRLGETLRSELELSEDGAGENLRLMVAAPTEWPPGARTPFEVESRMDSKGQLNRRIRVHLAWSPGKSDSGRRVSFVAAGANEHGTNIARFSAYVPAAGERGIRITEFLANPSVNSSAKIWNPLRRVTPAGARATEWDEYVEIANLGRDLVDLSGWTLSDLSAVRHRFREGLILGPGEVWVVYGGTSAESPVDARIRGEPASEGGGLGLNNGGDTLELRNSADNLVLQAVYSGANVGTEASVVLGPGLESWRLHREVSGTRLSPGELFGLEEGVLEASGLFDPASTGGAVGVALARDEVSGEWILSFPELRGKAARVWISDALTREFRILAEGVWDGYWRGMVSGGSGEGGHFFRVDPNP